MWISDRNKIRIRKNDAVKKYLEMVLYTWSTKELCYTVYYSLEKKYPENLLLGSVELHGVFTIVGLVEHRTV